MLYTTALLALSLQACHAVAQDVPLEFVESAGPQLARRGLGAGMYGRFFGQRTAKPVSEIQMRTMKKQDSTFGQVYGTKQLHKQSSKNNPGHGAFAASRESSLTQSHKSASSNGRPLQGLQTLFSEDYLDNPHHKALHGEHEQGSKTHSKADVFAGGEVHDRQGHSSDSKESSSKSNKQEEKPKKIASGKPKRAGTAASSKFSDSDKELMAWLARDKQAKADMANKQAAQLRKDRKNKKTSAISQSVLDAEDRSSASSDEGKSIIKGIS